jgi:hypothetical protein
VLAKKFRYTTDYLGQLCRGKKIDARLVGRAWYINLDSLLEHRANRHKSIVPSEILPKKEINNYLSRVDVKPALKHKTLRILKSKGGVFTEVPVKYESDEHALIPRVQSRPVITSLPILLAESERLHVSTTKSAAVSSFRPTPLPEVSLSGKISVVDASDITPETIIEEDSNNLTTQTDPIDAPKTQENIPRTITVKTKRKVVRPPLKSVPAKVQTTHAPSHVSLNNTNTTVTNQSPVNFSPKVVRQSQPTTASSNFGLRSFLLPVVALFFALLVSFAILSVHTEVLVSSSSYENRLQLQFVNILNLLNQLRD